MLLTFLLSQCVFSFHVCAHLTNPETQQFLEILHTYQNEQRGIKDVLGAVSVLFQDHPDLHREFIYFLPDAAQEQAQKQLNELVEQQEARLRLRHQAGGLSQNNAAALQAMQVSFSTRQTYTHRR